MFIKVTIVEDSNDNKKWATFLNLDRVSAFKYDPEKKMMLVEYKGDDEDNLPWNFLANTLEDIEKKLKETKLLL